MRSIRIVLGFCLLLGCAVLPLRAADGNGISYGADAIAPSYLKGIYGYFYCSVTNTGTTNWGTGHVLRLSNQQGDVVATAALSYGSVLPGMQTSGTFNFWFPAVAGTHHYTVQAWQEGVGAFGEAHPIDLVLIDHYDLVNDFRMDRFFGYRSNDTDTFGLQVQVTNTGTRNWGTSHFLVLQDAAGNTVSEAAMAYGASGYTRVGVFSFPLPRNPGVYTFRVRGRETGVGFFGLSDPITLTFSIKPEMDFSADNHADLLWYNPGDGGYQLWQMYYGSKLTSESYNEGPGWSVRATRDFDGRQAGEILAADHGMTDLLWRNENTGEVKLWRMNGKNVTSADSIYNGGTAWEPIRFGDFNRDGKADILWRNSVTQGYAIWLMNGRDVIGSGELGTVNGWTPVAVKDFGGDGRTDILWRQGSTGAVVLWEMEGVTAIRTSWLYNSGTAWQPVKYADFNADGKTDILWQNTGDGMHAVWLMDGSGIIGSAAYGSAGWTVAATQDFDGDINSDLLWRNSTTGDLVLWLMNGTAITADSWIYQGGPAWEPVRFGDFNGDWKTDILWRNQTAGTHAFWEMDGFSVIHSSEFSLEAGWEEW